MMKKSFGFGSVLMATMALGNCAGLDTPDNLEPIAAGDGYQAHKNSGNSQVVLLADQPSSRLDRQSMNHDGNGQNCLFGDGRVAFVSGPAYGGDNLFVNDYGVVGPGASAIDNVIAPSHLSPSVGLLH